MRRYQSKTVKREQAVMRGVEFIYRIACVPENFAEYGSNLLYFFNFIATTSKDHELRRTARRMSRERFRHWQRDHLRIPRDADAATLLDFVLGGHAAQRMGIRNNPLKRRIAAAIPRFPAEDYLWFDPQNEPPPADVPEGCDCGAINERGRKRCRGCRRKLAMMNRYRVWCVALTAAYCGECYGVTLGARYSEVLKWLPLMRPYLARAHDNYPDFFHAVYAVTHLVYTLNDYGVYQLSPRWLPHEYEFLKSSLSDAIALDDPDMVGEFLDSLMAFGLGHRHPVMRPGVDYLLSQQNPDGSWGDLEGDVYTRYHATWAVVDGLREYNWRGQRLKFPRLQPLLESWAE
jgi:Prenyltransferase and squalene oxidase repeat